jgi:ABC-2 type transport system permease protein
MGVSIFLGMGLGVPGGCMVPLEVFSLSHTMRLIAHATPQAWGNDAFAKLVGHGASITDILPQLGILAVYAVVVLARSVATPARALA